MEANPPLHGAVEPDSDQSDLESFRRIMRLHSRRTRVFIGLIALLATSLTVGGVFAVQHADGKIAPIQVVGVPQDTNEIPVSMDDKPGAQKVSLEKVYSGTVGDSAVNIFRYGSKPCLQIGLSHPAWAFVENVFDATPGEGGVTMLLNSPEQTPDGVTRRLVVMRTSDSVASVAIKSDGLKSVVLQPKDGYAATFFDSQERLETIDIEAIDSSGRVVARSKVPTIQKQSCELN